MFYSLFQTPLVRNHLQNDVYYRHRARPVLGNSFLCVNYPVRYKTALQDTSTHLKPILSTSAKRGCFHPGASLISTNNIQLDDGNKKITGKDMLRAMLSYIWPKVSTVKPH